MSERPIMMSAESVRAILAGAKTMTRRVVTPRQYDRLGLALFGIAARIAPDVPAEPIHIEPGLCPWSLGQQMWVREAYRFWSTAASPADTRTLVQYRADMAERWCDAEPKPTHTADEGGAFARWRSPIYMPRWASRLTLEVTGVRVERLQAITEEDAVAEGAPAEDEGPVGCCRCGFIKAWDQINGKRPGCRWDDDPWCWVLSIRRLP